MKKYILFFLAACKLTYCSLDSVYENLGAACAGINIAEHAIEAGDTIKQHFFPDDEKKLKDLYIKQAIDRIKAEESLHLCLVENALEERKEKGLPCQCEEFALAYAEVAGFGSLDEYQI